MSGMPICDLVHVLYIPGGGPPFMVVGSGSTSTGLSSAKLFLCFLLGKHMGKVGCVPGLI